jgi:hypothetical protein
MPRLPGYLNTVRIKNLKVNGSHINLNLHRKGGNVGVYRGSGDDIQIIVKK